MELGSRIRTPMMDEAWFQNPDPMMDGACFKGWILNRARSDTSELDPDP